jgi:hypothetical protein
MEENKINNKKILKYKQIKSLDIFSNIQSYDLTGITLFLNDINSIFY